MVGRVVLLVYLSGFAALLYQVLWVRLLGLVFGVTTYAANRRGFRVRLRVFCPPERVEADSSTVVC